MAKRTFKGKLSQKGIEQLIDKIIDYRDNVLPEKLRRICDELATEGVEVAKAKIQKYDAVFTSELVNSVFKQMGEQTPTKSVFYVVADSKHAIFVEFGTGQMGMEAPYPYPIPQGVEWNYNSGSTIFEVSPGQYGWFYYRDGQYYFTQGMPSRPFMYETALDLESKVTKIVRKVFSRKG